ncbi:endonuclease domain-containing protein [Microbacterium sp. P06]|uniref:endonuclease domain-containing protein n=1 Tax=Microbacterium sp. P06 TaxID=3366949 RepID=UPI003745613E
MVSVEYQHRSDLFQLGMDRAMIDAAVASGELIRARRDHYLCGDTADAIVRAVRVGGRLTCLSLLSLLTVFVLHNRHLHVHLPRTASRMRSPHSRRRPLEPARRRGVRLHWLPLNTPPGKFACVAITDALAHAVLCQAPRAAIATLDSALHKGLVEVWQLADVFRNLPARYGVLLPLVDGRAESGPETLMRLMLRGLGCDVQLQVPFEGIGRVDLLVDGWLVIECDSEEFHTGWESQERDRRRDVLLAGRGFTTLRPTASMIMFEPARVLEAVKRLLAGHAR